MASERIARAVLELATDSAKFLSETAKVRGETVKVDEAFDKLRARAKLMEADLARSVRGFQGEAIVQEALKIERALQLVGGVGTLTRREMTDVARVVDAATEKLKAMGQDVPPSLTKLRGEITALSQSKGTLADSATKAGGGMLSLAGIARGLGPLLPLTSVAGLTAGLVSMGKAAFASAGQTLDLANATGLSTDAIQEMRQVASQTGTSIEAFTDATFRLGTTIAEGSTKARDAVRDLGLSYTDLKAQRPEDQFRTIVRALEGVDNQQERNRLGVALFGNQFKEIAAAVEENYDQIASAAIKSSREQLEALDAAGDAWTQFVDDMQSETTRGLGSIVLFVKDARAQLDRLLQMSPANVASVIGPMLATGMSIEQVIMALGRTGASARAAAKDIELPFETAKTGATDYVQQLAALDASIKALTPDQVAQLNAALLIGRDEAQAYADSVGLSEAALERYKAQAKEAESAQKAFTKAMAESIVTGDGFAAALTWMDRLTTASQELELRGAKGIKQVFEFEPDYGMPSFEKALELRSNALIGFHAKHEKTIAQVLDFGADPGIGLFQAALDKQAKSVKGTLGAAFKDLPNVIMRAVEGGGDVGKSVGAMFGSKLFGEDSALVKSLTGGLTKALGAKLGGALGSMLPGLGTALGAGLGALSDKLFGKLFGGEGKKVNDLRDQFTSAAGGIDKLAERAAAAGLTLDRFYRAKTVKEYEAAIAELDAAFKRLDANRQAAGTLFEQIMSAGARGIPAALRPAIEQLIELGLLTDEQIAKLRGLTDEALDVDQLTKDVELFGGRLDSLGPKFQQAQIDKTAREYVNAIGRMIDAGGDVGGVLYDAKEELSTLVQESLKSGAVLPANMQPWIEELARAGLLVDENGEKITDTSKIKYGAAMKTEAEIAREGWEKIIGEIGKLVDAIRGPLMNAINGVPTSRRITFTGEYEGPDGEGRNQTPGYKSGIFRGRFSPRGTSALLHGVESVVPKKDEIAFAYRVLAEQVSGPEVAAGGEQTPLVIMMDGQVAARAVVRRAGRTLALQGA